MSDQQTSKIIRQILLKRGLSDEADVEAYLYPNYEDHTHDPFLLTDMELAVERILTAIEAESKIVVYGDYDIDGITASAVMLETISALGGKATSYIPNRFEEGYGINLAALKALKKGGTDLVISVDCGITSVAEAEWASSHQLELIITDHHAVPEIIPKAAAVINPKRPGDKYPFKDLAGVGVAFKLAQALQKTHLTRCMRLGLSNGFPAGQEKWLLDLVALGTVCDVVTLVGENRVFASYGLVVMRKTRRVGLRALAKVSNVAIEDISSYHLGFVLGPRMNAAGRLEHAARSLELITTADEDRAENIARELDELNRQRQADQARIFESASEQAQLYENEPVLVLADSSWSHGIVGIVASKLVERWRKPVLVMQILGDSTKGSARSLGTFNLVEALRGVKQNFTKFGGHHFAAGYTLPTTNINQLRQDLNSYAKKLGFTGPLEKSVGYDLALPHFGDVTWELLEGLKQLEPFGTANPKPRFAANGLIVKELHWVGQHQNHLKLVLTDNEQRQFPAIGFGQLEDHSLLKIGSIVDAVFQVDRNDFNGSSSLQLVLQELVEQK